MSYALKKESIRFILDSTQLISHITNEFYINSPIHYFNYVRIYPNGDRITLSDDASWTEVFLKEAQKHQLIFEGENNPPIKFRYNIWDNCNEVYSAKLVNLAKNEFNLDHGLTIIEENNDYFEYYYFCAPTKNHHVNSYYINNLEKIQFFIQNFKTKAHKLIQEAEKHKINFGGKFIKPTTKEAAKLLDIFPNKKYYLNFTNKIIELSRRELECLAFRMQGLTAKESAILLNVNYRTIEKYLELLRLKLGSYSNYKLIKMFSLTDINIFTQITKSYIESHENEHSNC